MGREATLSASVEDVQLAVIKSKSYRDVYKHLNIACTGGRCNSRMKIYLEDHNIDISHFVHKSQKTYSRGKYTDEELFSTAYIITGGMDSKRLIDRLVELGKPYACDRCGVSSWNNEPLRLQLEHIDGDNRNNTKENLSFLCPNCHSQTKTFGGGNRKIGGIVKERITNEE